MEMSVQTYRLLEIPPSEILKMFTAERIPETSERAPSHRSAADMAEAALGTGTLEAIRHLNSLGGNNYFDGDSFSIADASMDTQRPQTQQEKVQEFFDYFGKLGKLYTESVGDASRLPKFQARMEGVQAFDRETFRALGGIGERLRANPPMTAEEVGKELADILKETLERKGGNIDLGSEDWLNLQLAMAGIMIAAGATFEPGTKDQQNIAMVDAMDAQLRANGIPHLFAIIWGDTREPGLLISPRDSMTPQERHNHL